MKLSSFSYPQKRDFHDVAIEIAENAVPATDIAERIANIRVAGQNEKYGLHGEFSREHRSDLHEFSRHTSEWHRRSD